MVSLFALLDALIEASCFGICAAPALSLSIFRISRFAVSFKRCSGLVDTESAAAMWLRILSNAPRNSVSVKDSAS